MAFASRLRPARRAGVRGAGVRGTGVRGTGVRGTGVRGAAAAVAAGVTLVLAGTAPAGAATATVSATPQSATPGFDDQVRAVAYSGDTIYLGGSFTVAVANGRRVARGYVAAVDAATGALTGWAPAVNGPVTALAVSGGSVYLGGSFTTVGGRAHRHLARVAAAGSGAVDDTFRHSTSTAPNALTVARGRLYAGGTFRSVDGASRAHAAAFDLSGNTLDASFRPDLDGTVHSIAVSGSRVYLGGTFGAVDGAGGHARLAAVSATTGALDTGFAGHAGYAVHHVTIAGDTVYAAMAGPGGRLASYDRSGRLRWTLTADGDLSDVTVLDGVVYAGGHFDHACTTARVANTNGDCLDGNQRRQKLFAADSSGRLLGWAPQANSTVGVIVLAASASRHSLAVGGAFTTFGDTLAKSRFAQFAR
ncbi:hypothetical protein Asera_15800 [Actinocatenispora sera]|uniref:Uncharacterized protein n=1 Tax=Actinocatenispora sera TaxID=390989 RepID=A0A810KYG8_9ACTN|nr:hypothetical protein Asera_15800 [Actinocatenispora sera]